MRNLGKIIPISVIIVLIICAVMDSNIKKSALRKSITEELVEELIIGSYAEIPNYDDTPNNAYIICTSENIEHLIIDEVYVYSGIFGKSASVEFRVVLYVNGLYIGTNGKLELDYSSHSPCKWIVDRCWLNDNFEIME